MPSLASRLRLLSATTSPRATAAQRYVRAASLSCSPGDLWPRAQVLLLLLALRMLAEILTHVTLVQALTSGLICAVLGLMIEVLLFVISGSQLESYLDKKQKQGNRSARGKRSKILPDLGGYTDYTTER